MARERQSLARSAQIAPACGPCERLPLASCVLPHGTCMVVAMSGEARAYDKRCAVAVLLPKFIADGREGTEERLKEQ